MDSAMAGFERFSSGFIPLHWSEKIEEKSHIDGQGIWISNAYAWTDASLAKAEITHIISVGARLRGVDAFKDQLIFDVMDTPTSNLRSRFPAAVEFARMRSGPLLIHCQAGISRSTTVAMAVLVGARYLDLARAAALVCTARKGAYPNPGFLRQVYNYATEQGRNSYEDTSRNIVAPFRIFEEEMC